jgi:hypothetical protein
MNFCTSVCVLNRTVTKLWFGRCSIWIPVAVTDFSKWSRPPLESTSSSIQLVLVEVWVGGLHCQGMMLITQSHLALSVRISGPTLPLPLYVNDMDRNNLKFTSCSLVNLVRCLFTKHSCLFLTVLFCPPVLHHPLKSYNNETINFCFWGTLSLWTDQNKTQVFCESRCEFYGKSLKWRLR